MKSRKPTLTRPITPSTRATISPGRWRENSDTATVQPDSISTHSSIEPSCEPQVAATWYAAGSCEFEFVATLSTEKSFCTNDHTRQPNAIATNRNCPCAAGRASAIQSRTPRAAPTSGSVPCTSASSSARISAKWPSSGITGSRPSYLRVFWAFCACSTACAASGGM